MIWDICVFPIGFALLLIILDWPGFIAYGIFSKSTSLEFPLELSLFLGFIGNTLILFLIGLAIDKYTKGKLKPKLGFRYLLPLASFVLYTVLIIFGLVYPRCTF